MKVNTHRLECGCLIKTPSPYDRSGSYRGPKWRFIERGESCRLHIVGERYYSYELVPS